MDPAFDFFLGQLTDKKNRKAISLYLLRLCTFPAGFINPACLLQLVRYKKQSRALHGRIMGQTNPDLKGLLLRAQGFQHNALFLF